MFFMNVKEIDASELGSWMADQGKEFRVIDVREMMEIAQGSVPGAEPMPLSSLSNRIGEIERDRPVVFVCRSGARSGQVCAYLGQMGYDNVYNLRGGMIAWAQSGNPIDLPAMFKTA